MEPPLVQRVLLRVVLAVGLVLGTFPFGWKAPALLGILLAVIAHFQDGPRRPALEAVLATGVGWGALLLRPFLGHERVAIVTLLGGLTGTRGGGAAGVTAVLALVTLVLGVVLAWSATTVARWLLWTIGGRPRASGPDGVTLSPTVEPTPAPASPATAGAPRVPAAQTP